MVETSLSLLHRIRSSPEPFDWERLYSVYRPLLQRWIARYQLQPSDAEDVTQDVLVALVKDLKHFEHDGRQGAFRAWLKTILLNRLRQFWKARDRGARGIGDDLISSELEQLEDPLSSLSHLWNVEHDHHVLRTLLELVKPNFTEESWEAFRRTALSGESAQDVAEKLGLSVNAVFIAKSRVLSRLRQEAAGLIDTKSTFFSG